MELTCIGKTQATNELASEHDHGDFSSTEFETLEAIPIGRANGQLFFEIVGVDDRGQCFLGID